VTAQIKLKPGDLVVVAHWGDFDLADSTVLGRFDRVDDDGYFYICGSLRGYNHIRKVSTKTMHRAVPEKKVEK